MPEAHSLKQMRADIARASKRTGDPISVANKRRDYAAAKLEDYIRRVVDLRHHSPKISESRIAALLRSGGPECRRLRIEQARMGWSGPAHKSTVAEWALSADLNSTT